MAEIADLIRERRRQRLQAAGLPFREPRPLPADYHGRRLSIAETIRARRDERLMDAAAHQTRNL
jgi:hypothetical protein